MENLKEQADNLYKKALFLLNQPLDNEKLNYIQNLLNQSLKLYQQISDEEKTKEVESILTKINTNGHINQKPQLANVDKNFKNWDIFLKIGCFGFGGPMGVFSLLQNELVDRKKILTSKDFLEGAVLGDILPGPVTMDIVTYTGYKLKRWKGATISTLLFILPSFILMIIIAMLYDKLILLPKLQGILKKCAAVVVGLIISVGIKLCEQEIKDYRTMGILIWAFISSLIFKFDILATVALAGLAGILLYIPSRIESGKKPKDG